MNSDKLDNNDSILDESSSDRIEKRIEENKKKKGIHKDLGDNKRKL